MCPPLPAWQSIPRDSHNRRERTCLALVRSLRSESSVLPDPQKCGSFERLSYGFHHSHCNPQVHTLRLDGAWRTSGHLSNSRELRSLALGLCPIDLCHTLTWGPAPHLIQRGSHRRPGHERLKSTSKVLRHRGIARPVELVSELYGYSLTAFRFFLISSSRSRIRFSTPSLVG